MPWNERARLWYAQAMRDLEMARRNLAIEGYYVAAFLAQQAVEKLLKAAHVLEGKRVPRTHYIDELARALNVPLEVYRSLLSLVSDYVMARYPDALGDVPYAYYTEAMARQKVTIAEQFADYFHQRWKRPE